MAGARWTLLLVAAVALLPAWLVGGAALGAAAGLWLAERCARRQPNPGRGALASEKIVAFNPHSRGRLFQ